MARSFRSSVFLLAASTAWLLVASCRADIPLAAARWPFAFVNSTSQLRASAIRTIEKGHRFTRKRWSPDSMLIVACNFSGIWVADAKSGAFVLVGEEMWDERCTPAWSPDSRSLTYVDGCGDPNCLKDFNIYDLDSSVRWVYGPGEGGPPYRLKEARPLGIDGLMDSCFWGGEWSPDGKSILIGDGSGLYVVSVEVRAGEE